MRLSQQTTIACLTWVSISAQRQLLRKAVRSTADAAWRKKATSRMLNGNCGKYFLKLVWNRNLQMKLELRWGGPPAEPRYIGSGLRQKCNVRIDHKRGWLHKCAASVYGRDETVSTAWFPTTTFTSSDSPLTLRSKLLNNVGSTVLFQCLRSIQ